MFERYTDKARKAIFTARFEASRFGSENIETEHLLLGILRTDGFLALRLLKAPEKIDAVRERIEKQFPVREKVSASVDLPVSPECKAVMTYASEEANRLKDENIGPGHLLLGLLRLQDCFASQVMLENGVTSAEVDEALLRVEAASAPAVAPGLRDLTAEAGRGALHPVIGREAELERVIQILSRRTRNNVVLIGEAGVGKNSIVQGLAQRIADGAVPENLGKRRILAVDASSLAASGNSILYVRGLFDLAAKGVAWGLEPQLTQGVQCIATGTPLSFRRAMERAESLVRQFEVVPVLPPSEEEAVRILEAVKGEYEKFHGVVITEEAVRTAVAASRWFVRNRQLPDRAIDLIDEAGARVKLRAEREPPEIAASLKKIRAIMRDMERAVVSHEFEKARAYSDWEREERQILERVREELKQEKPSNLTTADDIVETVAARARIPVAAVKSLLDAGPVERLEVVAKELTGQLPMGSGEWVEGLVTYLAGCSAEDAEKFVAAIRAASLRLAAET